MRLTEAKPDFRIRLNGVYIPEMRIERNATTGRLQLVVRVIFAAQNEDRSSSIQDIDLGWLVVSDDPAMALEYRDETSWALLPVEMKQASTDKGWNRTTPQELMGVLWATGVLK